MQIIQSTSFTLSSKEIVSVDHAHRMTEKMTYLFFNKELKNIHSQTVSNTIIINQK